MNTPRQRPSRPRPLSTSRAVSAFAGDSDANRRAPQAGQSRKPRGPGKYRGGFRGDFLRAVAAGDMGQQQLADARPRARGRPRRRRSDARGRGRAPGRGREMSPRSPARRRRARNRCSEATSSTSPTIASLAPANSGPLYHLRCNQPSVGERYRAARGQLAPRRPVRHAECCQAIGQQRAAGCLREAPAEALGPAMRHGKGVEPPVPGTTAPDRGRPRAAGSRSRFRRRR